MLHEWNDFNIFKPYYELISGLHGHSFLKGPQCQIGLCLQAYRPL